MVLIRLIAVGLVFLVATASPAFAAADPHIDRQWGFARVGARFAWQASLGQGVIIAVVDTGVDLNHPDLKSRLIAGKDFVDGDSQAQDVHGHGTLVAGVAAASSNNGIGIASVAPEASIMPLRVFDENGEATSADAADAIDYAVNRAKTLKKKLVLNLSFDWSGEGGSPIPIDLFDPDVERAIEDAADQGAAVIIAAGNNGANETAYDATKPGVVVVGATNSNDGVADFSNQGTGLDFVAPGVDILSTYFDPTDGGSKYASAGGTSLAVPFVAGTAALLMSKGMNNAQAIARIRATTEDLGPQGRDNRFGDGLLDAAKALGVARTTPRPSPKTAGGPSPAPKPPATGSPRPPTGSPSTEEPSTVPSPEPSLLVLDKPIGISVTPDGPSTPLVGSAAALIGSTSLLHLFQRQKRRSRSATFGR